MAKFKAPANRDRVQQQPRWRTCVSMDQLVHTTRTDWVVIMDTDPDWDQAMAAGGVVEPVDDVDLAMARKGYSQYEFDDLSVLDN